MKEALQLVLANAVAAANVRVTGSAGAMAVVPEGFKLQNLEKLEAHRNRFRGALTTSSLADFVTYVNERANEETRGFVDKDSMSCRVIFNLGDTSQAGHGDDIATLTLQPTAAYAALQAIAGQRLSQKDLAEWMEDWRDFLKAVTPDDQEMNLVQAIAAVRNITIKASSERTTVEGNFNASRSAMDQIEAASQDTLPGSLIFTCQPYDGLPLRNFVLRLSVLTGEAKPVIKPRWVAEQQVREEIAQEFKDLLSADITSTDLTIGTFKVGE
ncbi:DUF2303 family protein [Pseudomonas panipatensis]|uniref:Uncharacterized conserved protein YfdQ, DUF2303 family n=1 Tax=Pseudomonas panipatensis TaxID=428992 RepID=A0A1G8CTL9_9PSED|nr:DUF2303 family protein [Pseudomonas panipatensis]SDH48826.1 Uncharacterized conserved protein YfdQ, DUF2303 family [Pseudomonas panipatensis]SMP63550.1 Uncharacterized conserved protein YfdQ, DUF2303 family [Pseudomonas panipatensis]